MFLWPLLRSKITSPRLVKLARRNMVAAVVALATSGTNIALLTVLERELGWVCLASCAIDVILNAIVIFWLTVPTNDLSISDLSHHPCHTQPQISYGGPDCESSIYKPQSIKAPSAYNPSIAHRSQVSLGGVIVGNKPTYIPPPVYPATIAEVNELRYTAGLSDFPVSPTVPSTSLGNMSMLASSLNDNISSGRRSTGLRSLGEFFGVSKVKAEKEMEVHISVVTQENVEMGHLESYQAKNDDDDSLDQSKLKSGWYK
ncbi:hypothetical protein RHS04_02035 [Rhizoctonia solani]|uniref:Uncharacterized protein n=1 Tax=Rhizoctonia solani TaxID=456999 RepID=A0A8H7HC64_9AGAM|nr:hypothetical protein RHS04_02035 [Rhizoctonia solani]